MTKSSDSKQILTVDITVAVDTLEADLFKIYSRLFNDVKKEDLVFEELKGGYVNSIQRVYPKRDPTKSLVFRTFGTKLNTEEFNKNLHEMHQVNSTNESTTNLEKSPAGDDQQSPDDLDINAVFFNRLTEYLVMNEISKHGLCRPVYAKYNNGIAYGYTQGVVLNGALMLTNDFLNEMATKLAKFHSIKYEIPDAKFKTHFDRMANQFGPMVEHMANNVDAFLNSADEFPYNKFPRLSSLHEIDQKILSLLTQIGLGEIVFCHNDANQKNVIWNAQERTLGFIDFEMSMNNYAVMEIGQLFFCYTGHFLVDFNSELFPNAEYRRRFLRRYLEEKCKLNDVQMNKDEFEEQLVQLFHQTNLSALFFTLRVVIMTPFFDIEPPLFKNEELTEAKKVDKFYCGKFGYKIYEMFDEMKDEFIRMAEDYLATRKTKEE